MEPIEVQVANHNCHGNLHSQGVKFRTGSSILRRKLQVQKVKYIVIIIAKDIIIRVCPPLLNGKGLVNWGGRRWSYVQVLDGHEKLGGS